MEMNRLTNPKEVVHLANNLGATHIGHEIVLADNLQGNHSNTSLDESIPWAYPMKVVGASLFFCLSGSTTYRVNLSDYILHANDVLIILPGSIIQIIDSDSNLRIANISFASKYFEDIVNVNSKMRENPVVNLDELDFEECLDIYQKLNNRILNSTEEYSRCIAKGYIKVICSIIFENWKKDIPSSMTETTRPNELYRRFLAKVQKDYHSHRSVKYYADCLCVTPKYLSMVVKSESGRNASEFIDELVVFESKSLLLQPEYTVQEVAYMMNFPNPSFFSRFFRRLCGMTPKAYKRLNSK